MSRVLSITLVLLRPARSTAKVRTTPFRCTPFVEEILRQYPYLVVRAAVTTLPSRTIQLTDLGDFATITQS